MNSNLRLGLSGILAMIPSLIFTTLRGVHDQGSLSWAGLFIYGSWFAGIYIVLGLLTRKEGSKG